MNWLPIAVQRKTAKPLRQGGSLYVLYYRNDILDFLR